MYEEEAREIEREREKTGKTTNNIHKQIENVNKHEQTLKLKFGPEIRKTKQ